MVKTEEKENKIDWLKSHVFCILGRQTHFEQSRWNNLMDKGSRLSDIEFWMCFPWVLINVFCTDYVCDNPT